MIRQATLIAIMLLMALRVQAAETAETDSAVYEKPYKFTYKQLIVPGALIGVSLWANGNHWWQSHINEEISQEIDKHGDRKLKIDGITQYAPAASMYVLDLCGVKSRHTAVEQTVLLGMAAMIEVISVQALKHSITSMRPDQTTDDSFPSGHTAMAFMGAELLRREYSGTSPWIGVGGYAVATATGIMRMYNRRHWLSDVIAGAGIGILSVEAAYWLYPMVTKTIFPTLYHKNIYIGCTPYSMMLTMKF